MDLPILKRLFMPQPIPHETKIVNCREEVYDIYIGEGSYWNCPYKVGKDGNRATVMAKYRIYLLDKLRNHPEYWHDLAQLEGKTLGCWCHPKKCHGDIILEFIQDRQRLVRRLSQERTLAKSVRSNVPVSPV